MNVEREHDQVLEVEHKGAHKDVDSEDARGHGCRHNPGGGRVAHDLAQAPCSAVEDVGGRWLGEEEEERDERRAREPMMCQ